MNGKKKAPGRAKQAAPSREAAQPSGRKPKASQQRRTAARAAPEAPVGRASGPKPGRATSAPSASGASRPPRGPKTGAARPRPTSSAPSLDAPPAEAVFRDRDGEPHSFPDSSLKRVAARLLSEKKKPWRYRPFSFPLFTQTGREQTFTPDFVVYDHQDAVLRVIIVAARDSAELWDRLGRLKRQYPMYPAELWTPEKLAQLTRPRARLGF